MGHHPALGAGIGGPLYAGETGFDRFAPKALQRDKGVVIAFTSIRHSLGQLASRHEVEASPDGKTWRTWMLHQAVERGFCLSLAREVPPGDGIR